MFDVHKWVHIFCHSTCNCYTYLHNTTIAFLHNIHIIVRVMLLKRKKKKKKGLMLSIYLNIN